MEQALIFASIIIGVAVSDQILSLNRLLRADSPVRWHWALPLTTLLVLLTNVQIWWSLAGGREQKISIGEFLPALVQLTLVALLSAATLPDQVDDEGLDLGHYYDRHRRYIWTLFAIALLWAEGTAFVATLRAELPMIEFFSNRMIDFVALGVMVMLAFVRRRWLVAAGLRFLFLGPIGWLSRTVN